MRPKNADLLAEIKRCRQEDMMSDHLACMLINLATYELNKAPWTGLQNKDYFISNAVLQMTKGWKSFNPELSNNPLAFFSAVIKCSILGMLNSEKKVKDLLIYVGPRVTTSSL